MESTKNSSLNNENQLKPEEVIREAERLGGNADEDAAGVIQALNTLLEQYPMLAVMPPVETIEAYHRAVEWLNEHGTFPTDTKRSFFRYHIDEQGKYVLDATGLQMRQRGDAWIE